MYGIYQISKSNYAMCGNAQRTLFRYGGGILSNDRTGDGNKRYGRGGRLLFITLKNGRPIPQILSALAGRITITLGGLLGRERGSRVDRLGLAPCGVYPAAFVAKRAVRSYRTFSPLPCGGIFSAALSVRRKLTSVSPPFQAAHCPVESGSSSPVR